MRSESKFKKGDIVEIENNAKELECIRINDKDYINEKFVVTRVNKDGTILIKRKNGGFIISDNRKMVTNCSYNEDYLVKFIYDKKYFREINFEFLKTK